MSPTSGQRARQARSSDAGPSQAATPSPAGSVATDEPGDSMAPQVSVANLGLTVLVDPKKPAADVVFIHGLQGHPKKTWTYKGDRPRQPAGDQNQEKETQGCWPFNKEAHISLFWPQALLPADRKDVRVMTYGYDSRMTQRGGQGANKMTLHDHGRGFLNTLTSERIASRCRDRPLIFVAHSLGGLIVKEALRLSMLAGSHDDLNSVYTSTYATIFFGTPHRGSQDAAWGDAIRSLLSWTMIDTSSSLLRELNPQGGGSKLDELCDAFNQMLQDRDFKVYTFVEAQGKVGCGCLSKQVVLKESAVLHQPPWERVDYISANHLDMCKFKGRHDDGYEKFLAALNESMKKVQSRQRRGLGGAFAIIPALLNLILRR